MLALGWQSKREITRTRARVLTAMAAQTREQGRYLGGRPPYGYRLAGAGPHPNKAHAAWGRRAHRLEPDPVTAPVVQWMFTQRLARHSLARITRALNDAQVPCPSAADPARNPHRSGSAWTLTTVAAILANPPLHREAGMEPPAHRSRPDRPGQHDAGSSSGAAVEPARRLGHLPPPGPSCAGQRGGLHRRPGGQRSPRPGRLGRAPVPAGRPDPLRSLRAAARIHLVQRPPRLPVPPRPHHRSLTRTRPQLQERLHTRRPDHPAPGSPRHPARRPRANPQPSGRSGLRGHQPGASRPADQPPASHRPHAHLRSTAALAARQRRLRRRRHNRAQSLTLS